VLLDVCLGQRECHEEWLDRDRALTRRGLRAPALVGSDGAPGLIRAAEGLWPDADRQRGAVHRLRNLLAQLPKDPARRDRVRAAYWAALDEASTVAEARLRGVVADLERPYPSAAACLADDLPGFTIHPRYPERLRRRLRRTNLLERSLEEVRRRTKLIGRFPAEASCLSLCGAVLDVVISGAKGLGLTDLDRQHLAHLHPVTPKSLSMTAPPRRSLLQQS